MTSTPSCEEKREAFLDLRKAALLSNSNPLWRAVSCVYKAQGLSETGAAARRFGRTDEAALQAILEELLKENPIRALRLAGNVGGAIGARVVEQALRARIPARREFRVMLQAAYAAGAVGGPEGLRLYENILDRAHHSERPAIRIQAAYGFVRSGATAAEDFVMSLVDDFDKFDAYDQPKIIEIAAGLKGKARILTSLAEKGNLLTVRNIVEDVHGMADFQKSRNALSGFAAAGVLEALAVSHPAPGGP